MEWDWKAKVAAALGGGVLFYLAAPLLDRLNPYRPGEPCSPEGSGICWGNETLLKCDGGKWVEQPCRGPNGCTGRHVSRRQGDQREPSVCDTSRNRPGDVCFGDAPRCTPDRSTVLACSSGRIAATPCPSGCKNGVCPAAP